MTFKFKHMEKIVGFFMLTGIILLLITVILMGREQKWFEGSFSFKTIFNNGENLSKGMDVKINDLVVGKVSTINFSTNNKIVVEFYIYEEYLDKVKSDSYVFKESSSPLGGGYLNVTIGTMSGKKVFDKDLLLSQDSTIVQDLIADDLIQQKKSSFDKIIKNIHQLTAQLSSPKGPLMGTLNNIKTISGRFSSGNGSLYSFLNDKNLLYQEILTAMTTLKLITKDLSVLSGTLRESSPDVKNIIKSAEKGLNETTKVMVGLQKYFSVQSSQQKAKTTLPIKTIKINRRNEDY